ncbi:ribonuclease H2 non-catalytic subunit [Purpureocillium lavendulum]|uniref:Ribonuclease H2 non-catalytic subunit n=1 Tax=Purpureocillium lavendulum TaxID=1247861 RepID=A0AB34FXI7_9HYPO|nr:ribonuclease H2 non-catalytic subunit [Purpureocillium lavendulum]
MSQPILSIERGDASRTTKAVPNLLPCRIHHNGPVDPVSSYWNPDHTQSSASEAYFRGRKLQGKKVPVPDQYEGVVVERKQPQGNAMSLDPQSQGQTAGGADADADIDTTERGAMHVTAQFDEVTVWFHQAAADSASDPYIRSIEEWLHVADQIHSHSADGQPSAA